MPSPLPSTLHPLNSLAAISVTGADAITFLQGQLSNDLELLSASRSLLASCNSAQGRVQAVIRLIQRSDSILLVLPDALVESLLLRLRKYVLRSKLTLVDTRNQLHLYWAAPADLEALGLSQPTTPNDHTEQNGVSILRWPDPQERYLVVSPPIEAGIRDDANEAWRLADIRLGLAPVYPQTQEAFVAQMLNLDLVGGISFEKGCYTGQEIIARTHFRGNVKRRMFRFRATCAPPSPGTRVLSAGSHAGEVVDAVATGGGCELLAVIALAQVNQELEIADVPGAPLVRLELPYAIELG